MTLVLHCLFHLLLQSFPMFSVSQIFSWLNNKQRSHSTWLAWISRDCHLMSVAIIYLNIYWVPIKFQEREAPICTAVSKIQLPVDNLLKALIVILRKQKPWCFSPSKKHHKPYTYFQSHIPFSSSEKILRHPHFFQRYIWSLFKKNTLTSFQMHINFYFKVTLLENITCFLPGRPQKMFRTVQGMGEIGRKFGYKSEFAAQMSNGTRGFWSEPSGGGGAAWSFFLLET